MNDNKDNPLSYGMGYTDPNNPLNLDKINQLALGPLYAPRDALIGAGVGTNAAGSMPIYRGQLRGTEPSGNFFSEDQGFAKQFTRSGLDSEVITRHIDPAQVYNPSKSVYAGDEDAVDAAISEAKVRGLSAVRLSEAKGSAPGEQEPASIFVFDKSALRRNPF